jgi:hypothetical protein
MKNHISLSINLYWIKKWSNLDTKNGKWSYGWSTPSYILEESMPKQDQIGNPHEAKKRWSGKIQYWCKLKLKKLFLYFLSIGTSYY